MCYVSIVDMCYLQNGVSVMFNLQQCSDLQMSEVFSLFLILEQ